MRLRLNLSQMPLLEGCSGEVLTCLILNSCKTVWNSEEINSAPLSVNTRSGILGKNDIILCFNIEATVFPFLSLIGITAAHLEKWSIKTIQYLYPELVRGNCIRSIATRSKG